VVDATLLRRLPFADPGRLMNVSLTVPPSPFWRALQATDDRVWSYPKYETFRQLQKVYRDTAIYRAATFNLTGAGEAERLCGEIVGAGYFPVLGAKAEAKRTFLPQEDAVAERDFIAVISHSLWETRYGSDPKTIGTPILLDLKPYTIVGFFPPGSRDSPVPPISGFPSTP
jgi:hypothetical protein